MRQSLVPVSAGLALGAMLALAANRLLASVIFGIGPDRPSRSWQSRRDCSPLDSSPLPRLPLAQCVSIRWKRSGLSKARKMEAAIPAPRPPLSIHTTYHSLVSGRTIRACEASPHSAASSHKSVHIPRKLPQ